MTHRPLPVNPADWAPPKGYNNGMKIGDTLFIAGQIAWDAEQRIVGKGDFAQQFHQALRNVRAVVEAGGGQVQDIGKLTIFVTDKRAYAEDLRDVGVAYRDVFDKHYPAMSLVEVADLLEEHAMVEIEAIAVIKESRG